MMYIQILFSKYNHSIKNIPKKFSKCILHYIILASLLLASLSGIIACNKAESYIQPAIPTSYLDCIELSPLMLGDYYFNYNAIYPWFPTVDEILTGRAIIMKNIEMTEEMLGTRGKSFFKVTHNVIVKPQAISQMEELKVGDVVDILGISTGISAETSAVILERCFIEPSGRLNLPLEGEGSQDIFTY